MLNNSMAWHSSVSLPKASRDRGGAVVAPAFFWTFCAVRRTNSLRRCAGRQRCYHHHLRVEMFNHDYWWGDILVVVGMIIGSIPNLTGSRRKNGFSLSHVRASSSKTKRRMMRPRLCFTLFGLDCRGVCRNDKAERVLAIGFMMCIVWEGTRSMLVIAISAQLPDRPITAQTVTLFLSDREM